MIRLDYLILGYIVYTVEEEDVGRAAELFLKNGISARFIKNTFITGVKASSKIDRVLSTRVNFSKTKILGFGGFLYENRKRFGIFFAMICTAIIFFISSNLVWDIRIEGCENYTPEMIEKELSDCGFSVGSTWSATDTSKIEVEMLSKSEYVSWININRRGSVAYVTVVEKEVHKSEPEKVGYANVIASCDAVIEEITVIHGVAEVKAGDSVKKGDLLISGVIPTELGGGFCYAEGIVKGRISDSIEVKVADTCDVKKPQKPKLSKCSIKIFGFSVNIFNSYRNLPCKYDIIDNNKKISAFGRELPISLSKIYSVPYTVSKEQLSSEEMTEEAASKMTQELSERLAASTLVRIRTEGQFFENNYTMISNFVCIEEIGVDLPFEVQ
jgi:similar to stage IV sporulation protein